ncbi:MAG: DNA-processing protein DprA [Patescibacteria group bacterium]|nr:DNA-processing protein DprA [Patescibacteria group bacterium]
MQEGINKITIEDSNYPKLLKKINKAPKTLYYKGKIYPDEICFAIVGTRRFSSYGKETATKIAMELSGSNITIVSGLAPGIDTFAHTAVVEQKKRTIAVLGTGLDRKSIYPKENIQLSEKILELGGCLVSEYPPGTRGSRFTFPERNRIISGLSQGVLVVEAKIKSGSLITANHGFSQNKKIFAIPGPIYALNSQGPHFLIKKGAKLVDKTNDILQELNLPNLEQIQNKAQGAENLEQRLILNILEQEALEIDEIIERTKLSPAITASTITILEMKQKIKNLGGNTYALWAMNNEQ